MFSTYQESIFNWIETGKGNGIAQARAGSGKSFTALHGMVRMIGKVCSMTFNKKNAIELSDKITSMGLIHCKAATFHAEGFMNYRMAQKYVKVDNSKVYFIAEKYTQDKETAPARSFIKNIVSLAKQNGFGVEGCPSIKDRNAWMDIVKHHDISLDAEIGYSDAIEIAIQVLEESNRDFKNIDFDDMIYLPLLKNLKLVQYDWVVVDEAQDTNVCRKIMAARMTKPITGRSLWIGDEAQAIYGFTGAENDSMNIIKEQFNCTEFSLPICYRCATSVIEEAQKIVPDIQAKPDAIEGLVRSEKYDDFLSKVEGYAISKKDAIICRNNAPLVSLAFGLIRRGIGCRIEGRDIGKNLLTLCNKWKVKDINSFMGKLIKFFTAEFEKPMNKNKLQLLEDKMETMILLIERCQAVGEHTVDGLKKLIESMFSDSDEKGVPNVVVLSSIHKAKGLEFDRVFWLGDAQFSPSKYATQDWQLVQESNLRYVATTRAMRELVKITDVPTKRKVVEDAE